MESAQELVARQLPRLLHLGGTRNPSVSSERVSAELLHLWPNFFGDVRSTLESLDLSTQVNSIDGSERELFSVGSELGLTGRVVQNLCVPVAKALTIAGLPNLRFGDAQTAEETDGLPDIICFLLRDVSPDQREAFLILVAELKTYWTIRLGELPVTAAIDRRRALEYPVGQLISYMRFNKLKFGFLSTYHSTVFVRRVSDYRFELSLPVSWEATRPSVRQCLLALCAMAANETLYEEGPDFNLMRLRQSALSHFQASTRPSHYRSAQAAGEETRPESSPSNITVHTIFIGDGHLAHAHVECTRLISGKPGTKATFEVEYRGKKAIAKCFSEELYENYVIESGVYEKLNEMNPLGHDVFASFLARGTITCSSLFPRGYILLITFREGEVVSDIWDELDYIAKTRIRDQCRRAVSFLRRIPIYSCDAGKHNLLYSKSTKTVTMLDFEAVGIPSEAEVGSLDAPEMFCIFGEVAMRVPVIGG